MSNVVFPWNQFEWYYEKTYDPRVPIYRRSDDAAIFFQALEFYTLLLGFTTGFPDRHILSPSQQRGLGSRHLAASTTSS